MSEHEGRVSVTASSFVYCCSKHMAEAMKIEKQVTDYTPKTEQVRYGYVANSSEMRSDKKLYEEFDRWLEEHDREVAKKVFDNFCGYLKYNFDDTEKFWRTHHIETYGQGENND